MRWGWMESMACRDLEITVIWQNQMPDGGRDQNGAGERQQRAEAGVKAARDSRSEVSFRRKPTGNGQVEMFMSSLCPVL